MKTKLIPLFATLLFASGTAFAVEAPAQDCPRGNETCENDGICDGTGKGLRQGPRDGSGKRQGARDGQGQGKRQGPRDGSGQGKRDGSGQGQGQGRGR